jgi:4-hydroxy-tetrahydrodipicolinate synthase
MKLTGCFSAIPTPFTEDGVDEKTMAEHAEWMVDHGVDGIVVVGTTGESATMTNDEKILAMNVVSEAVGHRATVVGGAGNNCTSESLDFVERVENETDVSVIMSVVPYYTKPPQEGVIAHFRAIADKSSLPVIIYNVPSRVGVDMLPQTMITLCEHDNIVGIKEASGNIHVAGFLTSELGDSVSLLSGDDGTAMAFLALGGHGVISVASNVAPAEVSKLCDAALGSDRETARKYNRTMVILQELLFSMPSPIPTKVVLEHLGFGSSRVRLPLVDMPEELATSLRHEFDRLETQR